MTKTTCTKILLAMMLAILPATAFAGGDEAPAVEEQMTALVDMCKGSVKDRTARHAEKPLYERLGGYDRILELTTEIVRLHGINEEIKHTLKGVDRKALAKHVADFIAAGTGGTAEYTGRDMPSSHAHLELTDAHFLAAGSDVMKGMKSMEYGQEEIDEIICILVSLKDQVVFR
ncbi:group 1 truncated hemoglobin [bacterium]|nr:group 1 truncated hemoglobin [bacterium]